MNKNQICLSWENINDWKNMKEDHVLINVNMIYWKYSEAVQKEDSDIVNKLFKIINQIDDEELKNACDSIRECDSGENETTNNCVKRPTKECT